ncbi:nucleotidyltransferase domain-containing protein [Bradyrhizobium yuanmingense]|uniref:nucleotidyltransferase domain-containing protein n=1 Tax=Bradyrhizobium yuanmingense TaxID=108015 RepID=UPI0035194CC2
MAIPEHQLETWTHQGATAQSRTTYATVKKALEDSASPYAAKNFEVFLQGSYGNDTNVYRDSDVDVVIRLDSIFAHDANLLPTDQYAAFESAYPGAASYSYGQFKTDVFTWLVKKFGNTVTLGKKAIFIPAGGGRRDCDVLPAIQFRYYYGFSSAAPSNYAEGICFYLPDGTKIVNFPKQHSTNCTTKHQACNNSFKPTVRIFKNMRNHLVDAKKLQDGIAPSYFIEGLLYNVPNQKFSANRTDTFTSVYNYLVVTDRASFRCANGIHSLLGDHTHVSWPAANCQAYLDALRDLWTNWR